MTSANKRPNLTLIANNRDRSPAAGIAEGLNFVSTAELSSNERRRVERLLEAACPKAGILAVARMEKTWDVRPVVAIAGEDGPSVIRLFGPDVSMSQEVQQQARDTLERLTRFPDLSSGLRDWNLLDNQIWFRRTLVPNTLAHLFGPRGNLDLALAQQVIVGLLEELEEWHSHGVVHGHITSANIALDETGRIVLLDAAVSAAILQASREQTADIVRNMAPELVGNGTITPKTDIFGAGQVFRRLLLALKKKFQLSAEREQVEAYAAYIGELVQRMIADEPQERPSAAELRRFLAEERAETSLEAVGESRGRHFPAGRIVRPGSAAPLLQEQNLKAAPRAAYDTSLEAELDDDIQALTDAVGENLLSLEEAEEFNPQTSASRVAPTAKQVPVKVGSSSASPFANLVFLFAAVAAVGYLISRVFSAGYETLEYDLAQLQSDWVSKIPSRMVTVAEFALEKDFENKQVQDLIVASANNGENLPAVDVSLLRIAFNSLWEMQLSAEDRRMALAFGLAQLMGEKTPSDLGPLDQRHPGVVLAVTASAGENLNRILRTIPADVLTKLPPPYGPAFHRLVLSNENLDCADPGVQALARFKVQGIDRVEELALYLREDTSTRLQALALMFSQDNYGAKAILERLLLHPNIVLDLPEIAWARGWDLMKWPELEPSDQLFVMAGIPPSVPVQAQNIGKLFLHPNAQLRSYGIDEGINRIKFEHPAALQVLHKVQQNSQLLNGEQLARLAELLQQPGEATEKRIQDLIKSEPPLEVMADILLASAERTEASSLDTWVAVYLNSKNWNPDIAALRKLSLHPDKYTRLYAYNKILVLPDADTARAFLQTALSKENDSEYRRQLALMIQQLN